MGNLDIFVNRVYWEDIVSTIVIHEDNDSSSVKFRCRTPRGVEVHKRTAKRCELREDHVS